MDGSVNETNKEPSCKLTMFPANEGDCFLLEFGTGKDAFRMMIDSGNVEFGNKCLKAIFSKLKKEKKKINLLLITHVDGDHIGGALSLMRLKKKFHNMITEVWHNGLQQIIPDLPDETDEDSRKDIEGINASNINATSAKDGGTSAEQSIELTGLIANHKVKVNEINGGQAISTELEGRHIGPQKDIEVFILLPQKKHLDELKITFIEALPKGIKLDKSAASEECMTKTLLEEENESSFDACAEEECDIPDIEEWSKYKEEKQDPSPTNAASIALIIRYHGKKLLFSGDARGEDLSKALKQWLENQKNENLLFDVVKLPHHGSNHNCMALLDTKADNGECFDGKLFLVSTNGKMYGHPGKEALAKIVSRPTEEMRTLAFNYKCSVYKTFKHNSSQKKYRYRVKNDRIFPEFEVKEK